MRVRAGGDNQPSRRPEIWGTIAQERERKALPMKATIDIDCTPEEARTFLGLPDVKPIQEAVMAEMQEKMLAASRSLDPEEAMKMWLPASMQAMEQMQKMFTQMSGMKKG
jgi:hypothetical protein